MGPPRGAQLSTLFTRWFGIAVVAHVVGNWGQPDFPDPVGVVNLLVGLIGLAMIARPTRLMLMAVASLTVLSVILEMPFTGNHWLVAGLAALGILLGRGRFETYAPALRTMFLVFYGFAAFSKLNSAFFDPSVSCAMFYANQSLEGFGVAPIASTSPIAGFLIWVTALVELSVVPLLAVERTRRLGVVVAATFHVLISFDLNQHFYDFTSVILALLLLFLPDDGKSQETRPRNKVRRVTQILAAGGVGTLVVLAAFPVTSFGLEILGSLPFVGMVPPRGLLVLSAGEKLGELCLGEFSTHMERSDRCRARCPEWTYSLLRGQDGIQLQHVLELGHRSRRNQSFHPAENAASQGRL